MPASLAVSRSRGASFHQFLPLVGIALAASGELVAQSVPVTREAVRIQGVGVALGQIGRVAVSHRGLIAVVQPQDFNVRVFDSAGTPVATIGRRGEAPGEFSRMFGASMGWVGDTIWVFERSVGRTSFFGPDGKFLRVESDAALLLPPGDQPEGEARDRRTSVEVTALGGATIRSVSFSPGAPIPAWIAITDAAIRRDGGLVLVAADPRGRFTRLLGEVREPVECTKRSGQLFAMIPLCPKVLYAVSPDGQRVATAHPTGRDTYRIEVVATTGDATPTIITQRVAPVRADQAAKDSVRKSLTAGQTLPVDVQRWIDELPIPDWYPPVEHVLLGADGTIWAKEYQDRGTPQRWRVFNAWGRELRSVTLPGGVDVRWARLDSIWAVQEDADGVEGLVKYELR
jgi:hypothetical protein